MFIRIIDVTIFLDKTFQVLSLDVRDILGNGDKRGFQLLFLEGFEVQALEPNVLLEIFEGASESLFRLTIEKLLNEFNRVLVDNIFRDHEFFVLYLLENFLRVVCLFSKRQNTSQKFKETHAE